VRFIRPPPLTPSDTVQLVAPASSFDRESFDRGLSVLSTRYTPRFNDVIFESARYLAGSDEHRLADLLGAYRARDARAIFSARGGYGVMRILPSIRIDELPHKILVGFSDITALHLAQQAAGRITIHGPVLTQLGRQPPDVVQRLWDLLERPEPAAPLTGSRCYVEGVAEGPLIGGNLSVLTRLLGTPYFPDVEGAILLLEDVGERPYRLDRMWTHLRLAGVLERIRGIVLGSFTSCDEKSDATYTPDDILRHLARESRLPCAAGFPIGHGEINHPVPLGARVRLDATAMRLEFLEAAVEAAGDRAA
jgi:muramoyltetrapeptide carboxypeptidase